MLTRIVPTLLFLAAFTCAQDSQVTLRVDATDAPRNIIHARMTLAVKPGPFTLVYPKWIPGEHMPSGPIENLVGLKITANGQPVQWRRDDVNLYAFHMDVPTGATSLDVAYDFLAATGSGSFSSSNSTTTELAVLSWNQVLLYPDGANPDQLKIKASLRVPSGWRYGTALPIASESGNEIQFQPAPLTTLVDSPVSTGAHYRTIDLGSERGAPHYVHIAADSDRALEVSPKTIAHWKGLVAETGALFGSRHYRDYHFLVTLSDHVSSFGLEHHESSDDRLPERTLIEPGSLRRAASLLPHEMTHSWNGKYRRPEGLVNGGFDAPMKGDLLWVYEGLTNYLGEVLAARSGAWTAEEYRDQLAINAALLDHEYGRNWRPLEDTAISAQFLYNSPGAYVDYRRSVDFYPEGSLIWLEADVLIRRLSKGAKSLNDFCRAFHGGPGGAPELKPYKFEDIVAGLNAVQSYDWATFFNQRLRSTDAHAPLDGITEGGWKLTYSDTPSQLWKDNEQTGKMIDLRYSIGVRVTEDGAIDDVAMEGPAAHEGVTPGMKLIAVNGRQFTPTILREAVQHTATSTAPVELLIQAGEFFKTYAIRYQGGERYPHLDRNAALADLLTAISSPLASSQN